MVALMCIHRITLFSHSVDIFGYKTFEDVSVVILICFISGLLIRYHLVSHYALDIFLKAVLEALHEPVGSKVSNPY